MSENQLPSTIPSILLNRFTEAVNLANNGKPGEALEKYQNIFTDEEGKKIQGGITGEFIATVELRKAYCLMDLQKYQEAKEIFAELDKFLAGQLETIALYDFYFSYGNTLGNLGLLGEMEDRMARAMNIATEYLQDNDKFRNIWYWVLHWESLHQAWDSLREHCDSAYNFGLQNNDLQLKAIAMEFNRLAKENLGII